MALFKTDVLQTAEKLVQKGKIEAAIKEYKKVVAKNPSDTNTLNRVGDLYVRLRKHSDAVEYYMKTAERYALDGFYVKAIAVYKKVQRIDSGAVEVHGRLADLYAKQGLINDARSHLNQLADHYLRTNDTPAAINTYERIVELDRESPTPLLRLADLYRENGQPNKATDAYQSIATLMIQRGQVDHAIQVYERALKIEASNLDFVSQAVLKIRDAGGEERALDLVARAERLNPAASELRSLVTSPQLDPDSILPSDGLAPLEEVEQLPTEAFVPPSVPDFLHAEEGEIILDLDSEDEHEGSSPALVDPDSFETSFLVAEGESATGSESDVPPPPEPFSLHQRGGFASMLQEPASESPPVDVASELPPLDEPSLGQPSLDEPSLGHTSFGHTSFGHTVERSDPTPSGEIDLGELEDITAHATGLASTPSEKTAPVTDDLDAAFDRQIDPGPVDVPASPSLSAAGEAASISELPEDVETQPLSDEAAETVAADEGAIEESSPLKEKLSEAGVFRKYGLLDKALDRLNEVLAIQPDHLDALSQAIQVLVERGDEARASTKAETLHLLCAQRNDRDRWTAIQELLEGEGYQIEGDRVRTPGELSVASGSIEDMPAADPYDHVPVGKSSTDADDAEDDGVPEESDFSALASEPLDIELSDGHDMLDSKEFPVQQPPGVSAESADSEDGLAAASSSTAPGWLDDDDGQESVQTEELFDDEEEFFDLASELQDDLGTSLSELDENLPENAAEQSLEEIVEGFKRGVAENISEKESDTHYNLGIAYREMMLLDEAISEFQISAKSSDYLIDSCAMLGVCFKEKGHPDLAAKWYQRAIDAPELLEEQRVGMLFELAESLQSAGDLDGARDRFTQVVSMSGNYREAEARLAELGSAGDG